MALDQSFVGRSYPPTPAYEVGREKIREFASKRRLFAHPRFKREFVPENVLGVYLPYLVIDARAEASYTGKGEVQTRRWTEKVGDSSTTYYAADVYRVDRSVAFTVDDLTVEGASVVQAGTAADAQGRVVSSGGRVLAVVGTGADLARARERAYARLATVELEGSFHRTDIAAAAAEKQV